MPGIPPGEVSGYHPLPTNVRPGTTATYEQTNAGAVVRPAQSPKGKLTKECSWTRKHHGGARSCTYYRGAMMIKKCVTKPHAAEHCTYYNTGQAASAAPKQASAHARLPVAAAAGMPLSAGWVKPSATAVVRIYWRTTNGGQTRDDFCSGSMIENGLVLTAGHCVYSNGQDGQSENGFVGYFPMSTYVVVPENNWSGNQAVAPYGGWTVRNMWTTAQYGVGDELGGDWGIIELNPNAQGKYPGDVGIEPYTATWNELKIDDLYSIGYATAGAFGQTQYGDGNSQYFCVDTWDQATDEQVDPMMYGTSPYGNYYGLVLQPCGLTAGASGGPVFTEVDGSWTIIGVNNRAPLPTQNAIGTYMLSWWLDSSFGAFWNAVMAQVETGA